MIEDNTNNFQTKIAEFSKKIDYLNWEIVRTNEALE